jgi:predicted nuclease of predicted toxin-antitoxin system
MKLLLDECAPRRLKKHFVGHDVWTIEKAGFKGLKNGELLDASAAYKFEILITVDKNIQYQQNQAKLPLAIVVLSAKNNRLESLLPLVSDALKVLETVKIGDVINITK